MICPKISLRTEVPIRAQGRSLGTGWEVPRNWSILQMLFTDFDCRTDENSNCVTNWHSWFLSSLFHGGVKRHFAGTYLQVHATGDESSVSVSTVSTILKQRLVQEWHRFNYRIIEQAVRQWRVRLRACGLADDDHFDHSPVNNFSIVKASFLWYKFLNVCISKTTRAVEICSMCVNQTVLLLWRKDSQICHMLSLSYTGWNFGVTSIGTQCIISVK